MENKNENNLGNAPEKISLKTISLKDLWNVLRGCIIIVVVVAIAVTGFMYYRALQSHVPMYSSTATICFMRDTEYVTVEDEDIIIDDETSDEEDKDTSQELNVNQFANDYNVAKRVINEYVILLKKAKVREAVINLLNDENGEFAQIATGENGISGKQAAADWVSTSISVVEVDSESTRIIDISVVAKNPESAKIILDAYCKVAGDSEVMKPIPVKNYFTLYQPGTVNTWPVNNISFMTFIKYGIIAGGLVYVIFLAMFLFDNYIRTEEDIEHYLGLTVLGDIPDAYASNKNKKKYSNYKGYNKSEYTKNSNNGKGKKG